MHNPEQQHTQGQQQAHKNKQKRHDNDQHQDRHQCSSAMTRNERAILVRIAPVCLAKMLEQSCFCITAIRAEKFQEIRSLTDFSLKLGPSQAAGLCFAIWPRSRLAEPLTRAGVRGFSGPDPTFFLWDCQRRPLFNRCNYTGWLFLRCH